MKIPIVSFVGKSGSGKTTLLEKVLRCFAARGRRVAAIKHDAHSFDIDHEGKDSHRLFRAGAAAVFISSPEKFALVHRVDAERSLDTLTAQLGPGFDLALTEGYRRADKPKIEVVRAERSREPICAAEELVALATDLPLDLGVPRFGLDDAEGICDLLEARFIRPAAGRRECFVPRYRSEY